MKVANSAHNDLLVESITEREREIIKLIALHRTNKEIAETLHLALSTVKWYTRQIFNKLGVNSRRETIERATTLGLLALDRPAIVIQNNLPVPATPFIGRETEISQILHFLIKDDLRLVTLHGPGGNGKTRLAIHAAARLIKTSTDHFPDGVWFVSLAPLSSSDALPQSIARSLGYTIFDHESNPLQQLIDYMHQRRLLLILDNFEHLITPESVKVITEINAKAPYVKLLVTSRNRLNIYGEQLFPVLGMQMPDDKSPSDTEWKVFSAINLFMQCVRQVQPNFEIDANNLAVVIEICQRVEGMPLGIELAAAWIELLPLDEIAEEIKRSYDFLKSDLAGIPERQRSIRAVFDSSWKLLTDEERQTFLRLCVVIGSISPKAAQQITGASMQTLIRLTNKSWLQQVENGKFQLHELMRQFGEEILKSDPAAWQEAKDRHAIYYSDFVAEQSLKMRSPDQIDGLIAIDDEFETNIKVAWEWLVNQEHWDAIIEKMVLGLYHYVQIVKRLDDLIPLLKVARLKIAKSELSKFEQLAFLILGTLEVSCEDEYAILDDDPFTHLKELWQLSKEHHLEKELGFWYAMLTGLAYKKNIDPEAKERLDEAVEYMRESNDSWALGISLMIQANWWLEFGFDEQKLLEASQIFDNLNIPYEQSYISGMLADQMSHSQKAPISKIQHYIEKSKIFYRRLSESSPRFIFLLYRSKSPSEYIQIGEFESGFAAFHEEQDFFEKTGHKGWLADSLYWESELAVRYSTFEHALRTRQRCLELSKLSEVKTTVFWNIYEYGEVYRVFGDQKKATELYEKAFVGFEKLHISLGLAYFERACGDIALQNIQYSNAFTHYQQYMNYAEKDNHLWSMAQAHGKLALAYAQLKNLELSRKELQTALIQMKTWGKDVLVMDTLLAAVVCLIQEEKHSQAVELAWFLHRHKLSWNQTKNYAKLLLDRASNQLTLKVIEAIKKRGEKMVLEEVVRRYI